MVPSRSIRTAWLFPRAIKHFFLMNAELVLAVLDGSHVVVAIVSAVVSIVASYLFLRANPKKKAVVDSWVNEQSDNLKNK